MTLRRGILRSLSIQVLGPPTVLLGILLLSLVYVVVVVNPQFTNLRSRIDASRSLTQAVVDILGTRARTREALLLFHAKPEPNLLVRIERLNSRRQRLLAQAIALTSAYPAYGALFKEYKDGADALERLTSDLLSSMDEEPPEELQARLRLLVSLQEVNDARLSDLLRTLRVDLSEGERRTDELLRRTTFYFGALLALSALGLWLTTIFYKRQILKPLHAIDTAIGRVTAGDLEQRLAAVPAPNELGDVAHNFNRMAEALGRTTRALESARLTAVDAARTKGEFLATMSHDIRTPMNSIVGIVDLLHESPLSPDQAELVEVLRKSSHVLLRLINDFLDHSRLDAGQLKLESAIFDVRESVDRVADIVRPLADRKGLALLVDMASDLPQRVKGDAIRFEQILLNLVSNAVKFTQVGQVRIRVRTLGGDGLPVGQERLQIAVEDTGIGIPEDQLVHVFERFVQAHAAGRGQLAGSGLGLSIVWQLTQLMGGTVTAESKVDVGSRFTVTLPFPVVLREVSTEAMAEPESFAFLPEKARVLIVDDAPENRFLVKAFLKDRPFEFVEAEDGARALDRYEESPPDLILMDMRMPVLDGFEATREIRRREAARGDKAIPIIALTASALPEDVQRSLDAGCDLHLTKPVRRRDLLEAVGDVLKKAN